MTRIQRECSVGISSLEYAARYRIIAMLRWKISTYYLHTNFEIQTAHQSVNLEIFRHIHCMFRSFLFCSTFILQYK